LTAQHKKLLKLVIPTETAGFLVQGLTDLQKAVKGAGFYPQGHPYRTETLQRSFEVLRGILAERELVLTVNRKGFQLDGEPLDGGVMVQQLAHECFIRRVASIVFMQDLLLGDLEAFVGLLSCDVHKTAALGGFAKQLEESGSRTVWINEKDMASIWAKRNGAGSFDGAGAADGAGGADGAAGGAEAAGVKDGADGLADEWPDGFASLQLVPGGAAGVRGIPELLRLMDLERVDARYQALGRELMERVSGDPDEVAILPVLIELLRQRQDLQRSLPQREYAQFALESLADGAAESLIDSLESRDFADKEGLRRVLAALGGKGAYWIIQRISLAEGLFERKSLASALVGLGAPAIPPLIAMLKDERWYVVRNMVSIIGELRSASCVVALKRPLHHGDVRVRKEAIRALMKIGGEAAESALIPLLDEPNGGLVRHAVLSLGLMRSRQAVPVMLKLLERRDLLLKGIAFKKELLVALGRIGDRRATGPLLKMLGSRRWPVFGRWLELKIAVASTLGTLGDEAALPALAGWAAGNGDLAEACREALDAVERVSGGTHD
jgi:HEAT repeat protein